ncbi:HD-GYP domain-containing protein [Ornithinimicrobium sp. W1679]|uniref:HD-GYP domain-containing protein n=1 Tax=unclassified Ornithinimicrobium TaxID=2615080 RepID=UPI003CE6F899
MILGPGAALVALAIMILGEAWRVAVPGAVRDAPLAQATGIAVAVSTAWPATGSPPVGLGGLVGPSGLAVAAVLVVAAVHRSTSSLGADLSRALGTVLVAGTLARVAGPGGETLLERAAEPGVGSGLVALLLLAVAVVTVAVPILARSTVRARVEPVSVLAELTTDLGRHGPLALATASTAAVMALSLQVLGPVALVLFLVPLGVLQTAVTRQRRIRAAQRQTLFALARLTDQAGLTARGHAHRVATLAVPVAREVGVPDAELRDVEAVALLHDVGQVGLRRPVPGGATVEVSARDQRRIASTGAAILARTAELSRLAATVADVGLPHHRAVLRGDVPPAARVVRAVSAYDDLTHQGPGGSDPTDALARLLRNTPHEYDPEVVAALLRHLVRRGRLSPVAAERLSRVG